MAHSPDRAGLAVSCRVRRAADRPFIRNLAQRPSYFRQHGPVGLRILEFEATAAPPRRRRASRLIGLNLWLLRLQFKLWRRVHDIG